MLLFSFLFFYPLSISLLLSVYTLYSSPFSFFIFILLLLLLFFFLVEGKGGILFSQSISHPAHISGTRGR